MNHPGPRALFAPGMDPQQMASLLAAIVDSSADSIISIDLEGVVMSWNPAAEKIFGYSAEDMIGNSVHRIIPPELHAEEDDILRKVRDGQSVKRFKTHRLHAFGHIIPVSVTASPVHDANGAIVGASKITRDLTKQEIADQALQESEWRFRTMANNIPQLAWMADNEGYIYWYNQRWYDYTGTVLEDMKGWGWKVLHHPDHLDRVVERLQHSWDTGDEWEDIFPLRGADGQYRWFLSRALPIRNDHGDILCWFGTNTDISEERAQKEQIRLLMGEVNHRSKNMLAMIQALARRTGPSDHPEFIRRFEQRIRAMAANQDILIEGHWKGAPIRNLVKAQLYYIEDLIGKRIFLAGPHFQIKPSPAETLGMAVHELATNATKYGALSNETGRVDIKWDIIEADQGEPVFTLQWKETGGPPVTPPSREGFGSTVIKKIPAASLGGDVQHDFSLEGVEWKLTCPADRVA